MTELERADAKPDPKLKEPCADPVALPPGAMSQGLVERLWARDRVALADCKARHGGLDAFYDRRDAGLAGKPSP